MKLSNKIVIISMCVFGISAIFFVMSFFNSAGNANDPQGEFAGEEKPSGKAIEAENNISEPAGEEKPRLSYVIKLDDEKICAYMLYDGREPLLWNSTDIPPALSEEDKAALRQGIYTNSFEELCLYFEAYAS